MAIRPTWTIYITQLDLYYKKQVDNFLGIDFHKMHRTYYKELVK